MKIEVERDRSALQFVLAVKSQERQKHRSGAGIMATIGGAFMGVAFAATDDNE